MYDNVQKRLISGDFDCDLKKIYETDDDVLRQRARYADLLKDFGVIFGDADENENIRFFSAPGRTEIGGNHTDHNNGQVIVAAVNIDTIAAAAKNTENIIRIKSKKYPNMDKIDLSDLRINDKETGHSASLIRGICARFTALGYKVGGFNAVTTSNVLRASGLSSSAAFEVLVSSILNYLFNEGKISPVEIAKISQYAENVYYGKPCGLMDQMASSLGGFTKINFRDTSSPIVSPVDFDFASCGHALCIVDTKGDHSDLSDEYAAIKNEMAAVAKKIGAPNLGNADEAELHNNIASLKEQLGERAILRALHFFGECKRVDRQVAALEKGDFETFKKEVIESGNSSYMYNQNVYSSKNITSQPVSLALAISEMVLAGKGAWRVHGGGFAGTIQAFVPVAMLEEYKGEIEKIFGTGSCLILNIRKAGGTELGVRS